MGTQEVRQPAQTRPRFHTFHHFWDGPLNPDNNIKMRKMPGIGIHILKHFSEQEFAQISSWTNYAWFNGSENCLFSESLNKITKLTAAKAYSTDNAKMARQIRISPGKPSFRAILMAEKTPQYFRQAPLLSVMYDPSPLFA